MNINHYNSPWPHIVVENMFNNELLSTPLPDIEDSFWDQGKHYNNEYTNKKEICDIAYFPGNFKEVIKYFTSNKFISELEKLTDMNGLLIDNNIYGGGLCISGNGDYLQKHIDFNYNNDIQLYRAVNVILYLNRDWTEEDGGLFELYDKHLVLQKTIVPSINKVMIFKSNNSTIHGFSKIHKDSRKSLNLWYYTKDPPPSVDKEPHKTIWM
jgi:Rps23 Pro-64 3,4-dihydroxylase Tpa1-like proline 4-hydroxylase